MKAEILLFTRGRIDGEVVATVTHENGKVAITSKSPDFKFELERGIHGRRGVVYTPADGDNFVMELPYVYSGSMLRARVI